MDWREKVRSDFRGILSEEQIEKTISYWENLLEQEKRQMSDEIRNTDTSELYDGDGETHSGWEQARNYFSELIYKK